MRTTRIPYGLLLALSLAGCKDESPGGGGGCEPGAAGCECVAGACMAGLVCHETNVCVFGEGDGDGDGDAESGSAGDGDGDGDGENGPPVVANVVTEPQIINSGMGVVFTATVVDPEGDEDVVGGILKTEAGLEIAGSFQHFGEGVWKFPTTWEDINQQITLQNGTLILKAEFIDQGQLVGVGDAPIMTCGLGQTACGLACTDTRIDESNCGSCGEECEPNQTCEDSVCEGGGGYQNYNNYGKYNFYNWYFGYFFYFQFYADEDPEPPLSAGEDEDATIPGELAALDLNHGGEPGLPDSDRDAALDEMSMQQWMLMSRQSRAPAKKR